MDVATSISKSFSLLYSDSPIDNKKKVKQHHSYGLISRLRNNDPRTLSTLEWLITARSYRRRVVAAALAGTADKHCFASMAVPETRMSLQLRGYPREEERVGLLPGG